MRTARNIHRVVLTVGPLLILGLALVSQSSPEKSGSIVQVDHQGLAHFVLPNCVPDPRYLREIATDYGIVRSYISKDNRYRYYLIIAICADATTASRRIERARASISGLPLASGEDSVFMLEECFRERSRDFGGGRADEVWLLPRSCQVRIQNMAVILGSAGVNPPPMREFAQHAESLVKALTDPAIVSHGSSVDLPRVRVSWVEKHKAGEIEEATVLFSVEGDPEIRFPGHMDRLADGRYQVRLRPEFTSKVVPIRGPEDVYLDHFLRVARVTGEMAEIQLSEIEIIDPRPPPLKPGEEPIPEQQKRKLMAIAADPKADELKRIEALRQLSDQPAPDMVPLFEQIMATERSHEMCRSAFEAYARLMKEKGLALYRQWAADKRRDGILRRIAVSTIQEYGSVKDVPFLEKIEREEQEELTRREDPASLLRVLQETLRFLRGEPAQDD